MPYIHTKYIERVLPSALWYLRDFTAYTERKLRFHWTYRNRLKYSSFFDLSTSYRQFFLFLLFLSVSYRTRLSFDIRYSTALLTTCSVRQASQASTKTRTSEESEARTTYTRATGTYTRFLPLTRPRSRIDAKIHDTIGPTVVARWFWRVVVRRGAIVNRTKYCYYGGT